MNPLLAAGLEIQTFFSEQSWRFCLIGGLAVIRWGEIRTTQDVDITLLTGFGDEKAHIDQVLHRFQPRMPDAGSFAMESRVLLVLASNKVEIDINLAAFPFEEMVVERATPFAFADRCRLLTCSAEDLIVYKVFANRTRDWLDVEGILRRQKDLDWAYIRRHLPGLCEIKGQLENLDKLDELKARYG